MIPSFSQLWRTFQRFCLAPAILILLCGFSCDNTDYPDIREAFTEKCELPVFLEHGGLWYDIRPFLQACRDSNGTEPSDWRELTNAHGIIGEFAHFVTFNDLLPRNAENSSWWPSKPEHRAGISFDFYADGYSNSIKIEYTKHDKDLCFDNVIHAAPNIHKKHYCDFSAHTISTSTNHISIIWEYPLIVETHDAFNAIHLDSEENGTIVPDVAYVKSTTGEDEIAIRDEDGENVVVENTIPQYIEEGEYIFHIIDKSPIISDALLQPVYISGRLSTAKWNAPVRIGRKK